MAVNWDWTRKMGEIIFLAYDKKHKIKCNFYRANCVGAVIQEWKEDGKDMYQFVTFWNDLSHLKRCLGLIKNFDKTYDNLYKDKIKKVRLNAFYPDMLTVAKLFAKAGFKVELYYKEVKEE